MQFSAGWGDDAWLEAALANGPGFATAPPAKIDWFRTRIVRGLEVSDGTFESPRRDVLLDEVAHVVVRRVRVPGVRRERAFVVLAGSREEGFRLRHWVWDRAVRRHADAYFLENPYYGRRRAVGQQSANIPTVSQHLAMNLASVAEASALIRTLANDYSRLAVAGYSMGGFMATLTAQVTPVPLALAALAAGMTPRPIYTTTLFSRAIDFAALAGNRGCRSSARERLGSLIHLGSVEHFPTPPRPDAAVIVGCRRDGFVPPIEAERLHRLFEGSELRWLNTGHVVAPLSHAAPLRRALVDALNRL